MIVFNNRMVHGCPLQYYSSQQKSVFLNNYYFSNYYGTIDMSEELLLPRSPSGHNSDSDNSVSSADVPLRETTINLGNLPKKETGDIKCCWQDCGMWFESLERLANHVAKSHASSGPGGLFYCGWEGCPRNQRGFNARYKMLVHVRTHTNEKPHRCNQCEKSFSRAENLKIHSRSHSGEKPYICPVPGCQKAYSNSSDRFKHTRTHQVDKPYMCKVPGCSKRYTDPSSLRKHVKTYRHFADAPQKLNSSENVNFSMLPKLEINLNNVDALSKTTSNERLNEVEVSNSLINIERVTNNQDVKLYRDENQSSQILPVYDELTCSNSSSNYYQNTVLQHKMSTQCNCTHTCSMSEESQLKVGQNDFIQLGSLIDLSRTGTNKWDKIWDPFTVVQKQNDNETMDVDLPLDLTVVRK